MAQRNVPETSSNSALSSKVSVYMRQATYLSWNARYAPAHWWEFIQCQNYQGRGHVGEAAVALKCAKAAGFNWEMSGAGDCAGLDGSGHEAEGVQLLRESVELSETLGIECALLLFLIP